MAPANKTASAATKTERKDSKTGNEIAPVESLQEPTKLTPEEVKRLINYEAEFEDCKKQFNRGYAILQCISEERLYRATHATFEEYCQERWGITARHANRLMLADAVVANIKSDQMVSNVAAAVPENESQSRPLQPLTPEQRVEAARMVAQKSGKHTAKDFQDAANEVAGKSRTSEPETQTDELQEKPRGQSNTPPAPPVPNTSSIEDEDDGEAFDLLLTMVDTAQN